jgi:phage internal scaffolding protein
MSKLYREKLEKEGSVDMRSHCQRPGTMDVEGNPVYITEQAHKKECDVNLIIRKYDRTGLISHISKIEGVFGNMSGIDFKTAQDKIINAQNMFNQLPAEIRKRFENSPEGLLEFMDNSENRAEAIELGLIREDWTEETDGLGEHIAEGENIQKKVKEETVEAG